MRKMSRMDLVQSCGETEQGWPLVDSHPNPRGWGWGGGGGPWEDSTREGGGREKGAICYAWRHRHCYPSPSHLYRALSPPGKGV